MKYDFETVIDRSNSCSFKWKYKNEVIPLWVADMDFITAPCIQKAIENRVKHPIYGYTYISDELYVAYKNWWSKRHHWDMETSWMQYVIGIVPAITSIIKSLTNEHDQILIQRPVYPAFTGCIEKTNRTVISSDLVYENHTYHIDYDDLESKLQQDKTKVMILCNPHNPMGTIWDKETLAKIGSLCKKHHVVVIADEIHCDIAKKGSAYIPFASVNEECAQNSIVTIAVTKAFNLAGIKSACVVVENSELRDIVFTGLSNDDMTQANAFVNDATIAALNEGEQWLDEMCDYVEANKQYVKDVLKENCKDVYVIEGDATYLMWVDLHSVTSDIRKFCKYLLEDMKVFVNDGYGFLKDASFIRLNVACPRSLLEEGMKRLIKGIQEYKGE